MQRRRYDAGTVHVGSLGRYTRLELMVCITASDRRRTTGRVWPLNQSQSREDLAAGIINIVRTPQRHHYHTTGRRHRRSGLPSGLLLHGGVQKPRTQWSVTTSLRGTPATPPGRSMCFCQERTPSLGHHGHHRWPTLLPPQPIS